MRTSSVQSRCFSVKAQALRGSYSDKVLEFLVLLLQLFEDGDGLSVVTAELTVDLLHLLSIFI